MEHGIIINIGATMGKAHNPSAGKAMFTQCELWGDGKDLE